MRLLAARGCIDRTCCLIGSAKLKYPIFRVRLGFLTNISRGKYKYVFSTEDTFYKVSEKGKKTGFSGSLT